MQEDEEDKKQPQCNVVRGFKVEGIGMFLEIKPPVTTVLLQPCLPHVIVVMDTSGSMGSYVASALDGAIPQAMLHCGYTRDTIVNVITFSDNATYFPRTVHELLNDNIMSSGCTFMHNVFTLLHNQVLASAPKDRPVCIIGISDGLINDLEQTISQSLHYASLPRSAQISVLMIRLITSSTAQPDTRALACLGKFATSGQNHIYDIDGDFDAVHDELQEKITQLILSQASSQCVTISHCKKVATSGEDLGLRRIASETPVPTLVVPFSCQQEPVCVLTSGDAKYIQINGVEYAIVIEQQPLVTALKQFCARAQRSLELDNVMGNEKTTQMMQVWFTQLMAKLTTCEYDKEDESPIKQIQARVKQLQRRCDKAVKTAIQQVLQTATQQKVRNLNAQQCADYLRQSQNKALAKRTVRSAQQQMEQGDIQTMQSQAQYVLQQQYDANIISCADYPFSFYSTSSTSELFEELKQQQQQQQQGVVWEDVSDLDLLRMFGLMGVCYQAPVRDWVDPYTFRVKKLFGTVCLLTSDLREANSSKINGQQAELYDPSSKDEETKSNGIITGVLPLCMHNPPAIFEIMLKYGRKILEAHASINMRRMLAPIRSDMLGERIGVLEYIMRKNHDFSIAVPEWQLKIFQDVVRQLQQLLALPANKEEFCALQGKIVNQEPLREYLRGKNNISCIQKVLIALLVTVEKDVPLTARFHEYMQNTLHVLYEFDAYHAARHFFVDQNARNDVLKTLFQVDTQSFIKHMDVTNITLSPCMEGEEEDDEKKSEQPQRKNLICQQVATSAVQRNLKPLSNNAYDIACTRIVNEMPWVPKLTHFKGYYRFLTYGSLDFLYMEPMQHLLYVVSAIACAEEQDRFTNDGKVSTFVWNDNVSQMQYLQNIRNQFYIDDMTRALTLEWKRRDNAELMQHIEILCQTDDFKDVFVPTLIASIPNRSHVGYELLLNAILNNPRKDFQDPWKQEKLAVLISGRDIQVEDGEKSIVWCSGNFASNFHDFQKHFFSPQMWSKLLRWFMEFAVYRYRESNKANSHGHCNSNPSWWAKEYGKRRQK